MQRHVAFYWENLSPEEGIVKKSDEAIGP